MSDLPAPLTPPECNLRGYEWMPLFGNRLFSSGWYVAALKDGRGGIAALKLWWVAMLQVPAGSLPNDEEELALLADFGSDLRGWRKHRPVAMRGFVLCSDNRWYHPMCAEQAVKASECRQRAAHSRVVDNERLKKWRAAQNGQNPPERPNGQAPPETPDETRFIQRFETPPETPIETRVETPVKRVVKLARDRQDSTVQVQQVSGRIYSDFKTLTGDTEPRARAAERETLPLNDDLATALNDLAQAMAGAPAEGQRKPDVDIPGPAGAVVRRVAKACAMTIHDPYGVVRTRWEQQDAMSGEGQGAQPEVAVDDVDGRPVAPTVERPQPVDAVRSVDEQRAALLADVTPEQLAKAQRAIAARGLPSPHATAVPPRRVLEAVA
jgi:hypothetical protein